MSFRPENLRIVGFPTTETGKGKERKLKEIKKKKETENSSRPDLNIFELYEQEIGRLTPSIKE